MMETTLKIDNSVTSYSSTLIDSDIIIKCILNYNASEINTKLWNKLGKYMKLYILI